MTTQKPVVCWLLIATGFLVSGCATLDHPHDYSYTYYGGRWQRANLNEGRVGSAFSPAGSQVMGDEPVVAPPQPQPAPAPRDERKSEDDEKSDKPDAEGSDDESDEMSDDTKREAAGVVPRYPYRNRSR